MIAKCSNIIRVCKYWDTKLKVKTGETFFLSWESICRGGCVCTPVSLWKRKMRVWITFSILKLDFYYSFFSSQVQWFNLFSRWSWHQIWSHQTNFIFSCGLAPTSNGRSRNRGHMTKQFLVSSGIKLARLSKFFPT